MKKLPTPILALLCVGFLVAAIWADISKTAAAAAPDSKQAVTHAEAKDVPFQWFSPFTAKNDDGTPKYETYEQFALAANVLIALAGLAYALMLVGYVKKADQGTLRMQEIAQAVREGADAYLFRQFRVVGILIVVITGVLYWAAYAAATSSHPAHPRRRPIGVRHRPGGCVLARLDVLGHGRFRRHAAGDGRATSASPRPPSTSFGNALQLGYRTGTITGMLTDGLGLLGGSIIFLIYGEQAYEALLGFGFGGTLLGPVHACRRRHLHQGRRRRRRPGRQGRRRTSPRTIPATPPRSPTTWATTSATAPAWRPTFSRATKSRSSPP